MKTKLLLLLILIFSYSIASASISLFQTNNDITISAIPEFNIENNQIISKNMIIDNEKNFPKLAYYNITLTSNSNKIPIYKINSIKYKTIENTSIDGGEYYANNATIKSIITKYRPNLIDISFIKKMNNLYFFSIKIYPFKYNNLTKKLSYISEISLSINSVNLYKNKYNTNNIMQLKKNYIKKTNNEITDFNSTIECDYLIVTDDDFYHYADTLCNYRNSSPLDYVYHAKYIKTSKIYQQFEDSKNTYPKATAIKKAIDSLNTLSNNNIKYIVLFGSGYLETNNLQRKNYIPIFSFNNNINLNSDYFVSDDDYIRDYSNEKYPLSEFIGRLPARNMDEAKNIVDKIIYYQENNKFGDWKNKILFVADDGMQGTSIDHIEHEMKLEQGSTPYIPTFIDLKRLYMHFYPLDPKTGFKPTATKDLINFINNGIFAMSYSGHGGSTVMADERLFTTEHLGQLNNSIYPLITLLSCSIGKFRDEDQSLAEALTTIKDHGTIFVFAASNETFATQNNTLGGLVFKNIFSENKQPIGNIIMNAKTELGSSFASVYNLFGDPASIISTPSPYKIDKKTDIKPLTNYNVNIKTPQSSDNTEYTFKLFDANKFITYKRPDKATVSYIQKGNIIYTNSGNTSSNIIDETFIVPKNISVGDSSANFYIYMHNNNNDFIAYRDSIPITDPDSNQVSNNNIQGPQISFFQVIPKFNGINISNIESPLHSSDEIKIPTVIETKIYDKTGLYLNQNYKNNAGYGGLAYRIDSDTLSYGYDIANQIDKSNITFSLNLDSANISVGFHTLTVYAVNLLGGLTTKKLNFYVTNIKSKILSRLYVTRSPGKPPFRIVYYLLDNAYDGKILIYDINGHVIKNISLYDKVLAKGVNSILWDGKLKNNKKIGSGLYIAYIKIYKDSQKSISNSKKFKFIVR